MAQTARFSAQWTPGLRPIARGLPAFGKRVVRAVHRGLQANADLMVADLKRLTPRSDDTGGVLASSGVLGAIDQAFGLEPGSGDHVADGWTTRRADEEAGADFAIEVYNENPRFDAEVTLSDGRVTSLGQMLEEGTRPHRIEAKPGGVLAFFWPAVNDFVVVKSVEHPGTRPYAMVTIATDAALDRATRLIVAAQDVVAAELNRLFGGR